MKKLWNYRFIIGAIIGLTLMGCTMENAHSNLKLALWIIGILISYASVILQIIIAPNYITLKSKNFKCPDCGADLELKGDELKFIKHN